MDFVVTNTKILKDIWKTKAYLVWLFVAMEVVFAYMAINYKPEDLIINPLSIILNLALIFILYGLSILHKTKIAKMIYEYSKKSIDKLEDGDIEQLKLASFTKDAFWNMFAIFGFLLVVCSIWSNLTVYIFKDIFLPVILLYGLMADDYLKKFNDTYQEKFLKDFTGGEE